jgi:cation diffusion facilitator CzcD-associated flavoprotein CzcO
MPPVPPLPLESDLDLEALRQKYRQERDRRLRPDGIDQYVETAGTFAAFAEDPWADPDFTRKPLTDNVDVAIVGAGFGGLLAGARLRELGVQDIRLIDKGADVGGTWYWNRYPGIACDVESYVYLPLLEEVGYLPIEKYSKGGEIFAYCRRIAERFDLYRNACLQTEVTEIGWDATDSRWVIRSNHGDAMRARFVCLANGFLQKPKLPGIPGIESFGGHAFHTSRWDFDYTGGDSTGGCDKLADKRVGIIGTGATGVQSVPHLAQSAGQLYVFQRTPSSIDVRGNRPTDPDWAAGLRPGWHQGRRVNFQIFTAGGFAEEDLVNDSWTDVMRKLVGVRVSNPGALSPEELATTLERADFEKMEEIRARIDSVVKDPATAEALKPWYRQFCKRPCFHDEYLEAFNRPNVTLVDTHGRGVTRITERGVVVDDTEYPLDCLIFATGFEVGTDYERRAGFQLVGRDGLTLTEKWDEGVRTMHGLHVNGFPNCMVMGIAQAGFTVNFVYVFDTQAQHAAWVIARALERGVKEFEADGAGEQAWVDTILARSATSVDTANSCTPGYYNNEGHPDARARQGGFFFGTPTEYEELLAAWRSTEELSGLDLRLD